MEKPKFYYGYAFDKNTSEANQKKYARQREKRGFDDTELWNLDNTLANYILPRLKAFKKDAMRLGGIPNAFVENMQGSNEDFERYHQNWLDAIQEMIDAFEVFVKDENCWEFDKEKYSKVQNGFELFGKHFMSLWT